MAEINQWKTHFMTRNKTQLNAMFKAIKTLDNDPMFAKEYRYDISELKYLLQNEIEYRNRK